VWLDEQCTLFNLLRNTIRELEETLHLVICRTEWVRDLFFAAQVVSNSVFVNENKVNMYCSNSLNEMKTLKKYILIWRRRVIIPSAFMLFCGFCFETTILYISICIQPYACIQQDVCVVSKKRFFFNSFICLFFEFQCTYFLFHMKTHHVWKYLFWPTRTKLLWMTNKYD
jgi:hypothetical protein